MDITKSNFNDRLPEIEAAIDSAIFLAIDGEFTGLNADKGNSAFDLPAERYSKVNIGCDGICRYLVHLMHDVDSVMDETLWLRRSRRVPPNFSLSSLVLPPSIMTQPTIDSRTEHLMFTSGPGILLMDLHYFIHTFSCPGLLEGVLQIADS